jgi:hypothetical protein
MLTAELGPFVPEIRDFESKGMDRGMKGGWRLVAGG